MNKLLRNPLQFTEQLRAANELLVAGGYPKFGLVEILNLTDYKLENTPRIIWMWSRFSFVLDQLYLEYLPTRQVINITELSTDSPVIKVI